MELNTDRTVRIRELNDQFRRDGTMSGVPGRIFVTAGVNALTTIDQLVVVNIVRTFAAFNDGDDPHGEHDFGAFAWLEQTYYWKIDYYSDAALHEASADPSDPAQSLRVLTIMLADEY